MNAAGVELKEFSSVHFDVVVLSTFGCINVKNVIYHTDLSTYYQENHN